MYLIVMAISTIGAFIVFILFLALNAEGGDGTIKIYNKDGKVTKEVKFNDNDYRPYIRPRKKPVVRQTEEVEEVEQEMEAPKAPTGIHIVPQEQSKRKKRGRDRKIKRIETKRIGGREVTVITRELKSASDTEFHDKIEHEVTIDNRAGNLSPRQRHSLSKKASGTKRFYIEEKGKYQGKYPRRRGVTVKAPRR
jgi:hypothetical protein